MHCGTSCMSANCLRNFSSFVVSAKGSERRDFLREIDMMKKVSEGQNPHVVSLIGCVTIQEPLCLITEYMKHGDLLMYLRTNRKLVRSSLNISMKYEIRNSFQWTRIYLSFIPVWVSLVM